MKKGDIIIDVGANIGLYSIIAEKFIGKNGKIYAFEPSEEVFLKFKKNIKLNNSKIINLNKKAVSKKNGKVALVVDKLLGDGYSYISKNKLFLDTYSHVESITLDYFFKRNNLKKVNFIKIDVEGGELSVLEGAKNILLSNKKLVILLENSNEGLKRFGNNQKDLYLFLKNMGFKIAAWDNNSKKWTNKISQTKKIGNIWAYKGNMKESIFDLKP
ncbi:MAG: FkbM family methyltransferase [Candidatus Pacebacteria bacterium]|nr:FkbM family methyltransferase [Candidatus Paceibacterota bacterium]MBT6756055.1 FkbM family methyltransferase [Candidatus Paceibacterota bacterium]